MDVFISYSRRPDLEQIVAKVRPLLLAFFRRRRVDIELVDDVIQETLLGILSQHRGEIPSEGLFTSWFVRHCHRVLMDAERKRKQEQLQVEVQILVDGSVSHCADSLQIRQVGRLVQVAFDEGRCCNAPRLGITASRFDVLSTQRSWYLHHGARPPRCRAGVLGANLPGIQGRTCSGFALAS